MDITTLNDYISNLNGKHSFGPDGVPNSIIKMLPQYFRRILLIILNNAINLSKLPRLWKLSTVVFIKKDQAKRGDVGNYRPISLLCSMSKILDKFFVDKLEREIEEKSLLHKNQFGFRKGLGTTHAISSLVNLIQGQRVWGKMVGVIFVDLRKAFDSVDHGLLIDRMKQMGIDGNVIDYFKDFLSSRHFISSRVMRTVVDLRDLHRVTSHSNNSGLLQGSISGPVLFSLFIDVVLRRVPDSVAYADDLAIVEGGRNVAEMETAVKNFSIRGRARPIVGRAETDFISEVYSVRCEV